MEEQQKLEIAARIKMLREVGPYKQPEIADKLGIGLRGYQKLEVKGTTQHERCQELFAIHRDWLLERPGLEHVTAAWIWDGRDAKSPTPDPFAVSQNESAEAPRDLAELDERAQARHLAVMAELAEIRRLVEDQGTPGQQDEHRAAGG